ncbi:hypothetical protein BV25DRAFT_1919979 [Artomyces pyxidatus]|uniref:Uncharacterized protein n=1 Tax=Artomyces pyxidatus TaxID=48021 RepID=A0ACB8SMG9_9AGAM|nr:hypothetical protein BV25DRAFT_1919979 [Artomyces pyxidatus]
MAFNSGFYPAYPHHPELNPPPAVPPFPWPPTAPYPPPHVLAVPPGFAEHQSSHVPATQAEPFSLYGANYAPSDAYPNATSVPGPFDMPFAPAPLASSSMADPPYSSGAQGGHPPMAPEQDVLLLSSAKRKLPEAVQRAMEQTYPGCTCSESTKKLDLRHQFSDTHVKCLPEELKGQVPVFLCPHETCATSNSRPCATKRHMLAVCYKHLSKENLPPVLSKPRREVAAHLPSGAAAASPGPSSESGARAQKRGRRRRTTAVRGPSREQARAMLPPPPALYPAPAAHLAPASDLRAGSAPRELPPSTSRQPMAPPSRPLASLPVTPMLAAMGTTINPAQLCIAPQALSMHARDVSSSAHVAEAHPAPSSSRLPSHAHAHFPPPIVASADPIAMPPPALAQTSLPDVDEPYCPPPALPPPRPRAAALDRRQARRGREPDWGMRIPPAVARSAPIPPAPPASGGESPYPYPGYEFDYDAILAQEPHLLVGLLEGL